jgi:acetolactate decarboxylase
MKNKSLVLSFTLILIISTLCCVNQIKNNNLENKDILYQYSTIEALLEGIYEGDMTFGELKSHGNYGLGTLNSLDGEMIQVNGKFYQVKVDRIAYPVEDNEKTPFAIVTFFDIDKSIKIDETLNYNQFTEYIDNNIPTHNVFYLILVKVNFDYIKTRSVPKQEKPYPPLVKAVEDQRFFEFNNVKGTLVGFRIPQYVGDMNVPEYHFHFLTEDKKAGGHVLELKIHDQEVHIDYTHNFFMTAPDTEDFYNLYSDNEINEDVRIVEKGK